MKSRLDLPEPAGRTLVVGDIHGCWREFDKILDRAGFGNDDLLICVGDILNRGPKTWRVARFFRDTPNAWTVLGNHELRLARFIRGEAAASWSHQQSLTDLSRKKQQDWADWLLDLPAVITTPRVAVAHARLDPKRKLGRQDPEYVCAGGSRPVWIDLDGDGVPLWFGHQKQERILCVGHFRYPRVEVVPRRLYALDTGCVYGGRLTALVLPKRKLVTVAAKTDYAAEAKARWVLGK